MFKRFKKLSFLIIGCAFGLLMVSCSASAGTVVTTQTEEEIAQEDLEYTVISCLAENPESDNDNNIENFDDIQSILEQVVTGTDISDRVTIENENEATVSDTDIECEVVPVAVETTVDESLMVCGVTDGAETEYTYGISTIDSNNPYFIVFEDIFEQDKALNADIQYLSIDLSLASENANFLDSLNSFCNAKGLTLLQNNYEELVEAGLIEDFYFENGILFSIEDVKDSKNTVTLKCSKWRSGLGAIGATYKIKNVDGVWTINDVTEMWIS